METLQRTGRGRGNRPFHGTKLRLATAGANSLIPARSLGAGSEAPPGKPRGLISADVGALSIQRLVSREVWGIRAFFCGRHRNLFQFQPELAAFLMRGQATILSFGFRKAERPAADSASHEVVVHSATRIISGGKAENCSKVTSLKMRQSSTDCWRKSRSVSPRRRVFSGSESYNASSTARSDWLSHCCTKYIRSIRSGLDGRPPAPGFGIMRSISAPSVRHLLQPLKKGSLPRLLRVALESRHHCQRPLLHVLDFTICSTPTCMAVESRELKWVFPFMREIGRRSSKLYTPAANEERHNLRMEPTRR